MFTSVGEIVRIVNGIDKSSRRAVVSVDNDDGTIDVIYNSSDLIEEVKVALSRVQKLQHFELSASESSPSELKEYGNVLFRLKDFEAASEYYHKALHALTPPIQLSPSIEVTSKLAKSLSVGQFVLVCSRNTFDHKLAMICYINDDLTFDVMYDKFLLQNELEVETNQNNNENMKVKEDVDDNDDDDEEEECNVSLERLVPLPVYKKENDPESIFILVKTIFLNLARCHLKLGKKGWAIKFSSIALAISDASSLGSNKIFNADCLYLRGMAFLSAHRPKHCRKDAESLARLDVKRGERLLRNEREFVKKKMKAEKKFVKDITSWVEFAMEANKKLQEEHNVEVVGDAFIPREESLENDDDYTE
jgi:tetratricopeptide (TPR) repeat protein